MRHAEHGGPVAGAAQSAAHPARSANSETPTGRGVPSVPTARQYVLFDDAPTVTEGDVLLARGGLSHFRDLMARYARAWPYLIPEWQGWIAHYERMERYGYAAAEEIRPRDEESEPSRMCAAVTLRAEAAA